MNPVRPAACPVLALGLLLSLAPTAEAGDARALDNDGRLLTVGNWRVVAGVGDGRTTRTGDPDKLGWELREANALLAYGTIPGTEGNGDDTSPAISRDPTTGDLTIAWSRREHETDFGEIALVRLSGTTWVAGSLRILADGPGDQTHPSIVHDDNGFLYVAWLDSAYEGAIRVVGVSPTGAILGENIVSLGTSHHNGPPQLG